MFPLRDVIPSRTFPVVVVTLIVLNALAFLYEMGLGARELALFVQTWGVVPAQFSPVAALTLDVPARRAACTSSGTCGSSGSSATTSRTAWGTSGSCVFYLLCGRRRGARAHLDRPVVGRSRPSARSGAIAGVLGAYFVLYPQSRILTIA